MKFNTNQANEVKVGIIGYTTEETPDISDTGSLIFNDVVETVRAESERLRNKEGVRIEAQCRIRNAECRKTCPRIAKYLFCVSPAQNAC